MICRNCGQQIADGTKFCTSCGSPVILGEKVKMPVRDESEPERADRENAQKPAPSDENGGAAVSASEAETREKPVKKPATATWKVIAMLLAFLTILSLVLGGITFRGDLEGMKEGFESETGLTLPISDISVDVQFIPLTAVAGKAVFAADAVFEEAKTTNPLLYSFVMNDQSMQEWDKDKLIVILLIVYSGSLVFASFLILLAVILILKNKKAGSVIGFIGGVIAFLFTGAMAAVLLISSAQVTAVPLDAGMTVNVTYMPSIWLCIAPPASFVTGIVLIAMKKKVV